MDMADHLAPEDLASWQSGNFQVETIDADIEMSVEKKRIKIHELLGLAVDIGMSRAEFLQLTRKSSAA